MNGPERAAHTVELLRQVAARYPTVDAFVDAEGHRLSFGEWDRAADGVAAGLADHGVVAGDVVCLLVPSSLEYMVCYQAAMRLGAITTGVNIRLGRDEIEHMSPLGVRALRRTCGFASQADELRTSQDLVELADVVERKLRLWSRSQLARPRRSPRGSGLGRIPNLCLELGEAVT